MAIKIGLIGLPTQSINKGCEALTFSFLEILKQIEIDDEIYIYKRICFKDVFRGKYFSEISEQKKQFAELGYSIKFFHNRIFKKVGVTINLPDVCFDFTQGDSFTDLYGDERFDNLTSIKEYFLKKKVPLYLGSQTIGPFYKEINKNRALKVINQCEEVLVRDIDSFNYIKKWVEKEPILTTDVAFFLPYEDTGYKKSRKIGFNPSGLLWNGGYTKNNQFGLFLDYKQYCRRCISYAIENNFEVHLIGHVISKDSNIIDNDYIAILELHTEFPDTIVAPIFRTPMEAKTYISNMAAFTGARMHATIASISAGVPVLPFSYSRKFEGLFSTLKYDHIIHGNSDNLELATEKFENFINNIDDVRKDLLYSQKIIFKMKQDMLNEYANIFYLHRK